MHPTRAPGDLDGGNEGAKKARLPFEASERKAASDSSSGEPPADTVIKTYYSCGGPRASWEAAATVSAAARELVERGHVDMSAKELAKKVNKHLRATDPAGGAGFCVPVNGFYWRRGTEIPAEDPPALRAAGGAVFWCAGGAGASWSAAMATPWKACGDIAKDTSRGVGDLQSFARNVAESLGSNDQLPSPLPYVTVNGYYFTHDPPCSRIYRRSAAVAVEQHLGNIARAGSLVLR